MPKFRIHVKDSHSDWWEDYNKNDVTNQTQAHQWGLDILVSFNEEEVQRYGAKARTRKLLAAEFIGDGPLHHDYHKVNTVTINDQHGMRDVWQCSKCGCKGFRYGLSAVIRRTGKWRAKKYDNCQK